jgi:hypothetical protein
MSSNFDVQLFEFVIIKPDGSFIQRSGQFNIPVEYSSKNGSLSGMPRLKRIMQPNMRQRLLGVFMLVLLATQSASQTSWDQQRYFNFEFQGISEGTDIGTLRCAVILGYDIM